MARKDITLAEQLEKRKNWKKPLVDSVVATFLRRKVRNLRTPQKASFVAQLDLYEYLVTKRMKGAETGQFQAHHGGFMEVTDANIMCGAVREVLEETGYIVSVHDLTFLSVIGPELYRSQMHIVDDRYVKLIISETEAEPSVAFTLPLFLVDVDNCARLEETDGEVTHGTWMTLREIIECYGMEVNEHGYSRFNYFQYLIPLLLFENPEFESVESCPGTFQYLLN